MSAKVKLISFISAFVLVLGIMIIGVLSAEQVKVNIGGSVSFNATNVYAKVSGNISGAQTGNKTFSPLTYSAEETTGDESDWTNLALEFTETPDPIEITITVENLSTQRTLTVNLENTLSASGLNIAVTRDSGSYNSGTNVELPVSTGDGSSTITFILTLTVANPNEDLTNVTFGYILNLFDENYTPPSTPASSFTFSYSDTDQTASITKFVGSETEVVIPSTVEYNGATYKVTAIADGGYSTGAFYNSNITSVVIPDTVTSIGYYAFQNCRSLTSVNFGENSQLTRIGTSAFHSCYSLTSITIPSSVTSIGSYAFSYCYALAEVYNYSSLTITAGSSSNGQYAKVVYNASDLTGEKPATRITVVGNVQYYNYGDDFIALAPAVARETLTEVTLDNRTTEINQYAFHYCDSLTSITIPEGVRITDIQDGTFAYCSSLTSITIPEGVTSIGDKVFRECSSLTSITIPEGVTSIGNYAFQRCSSLTSITIPEGVTSIGDDAFNTCDSLTSITIPDSVTSIGESAFYQCGRLTSITIPSRVTSIGERAFDSCYSLVSVTIPSRVTSIGERAFYGCSSLTLIEVDSLNTAYSSEDGVLFNKDKTILIQYPAGNTRTSYTIPSSVTSIGESAFSRCRGLSSIEVNSANTAYSSEDGVLFNKDKTILIQYPTGNTRTSYTIPSSVTSIVNYAFSSCSSLTSITIPDSVTSIGESAFWDCSRLATIRINATTPPTLGSSAIIPSNVTNIYVPAGSVNAYKAASGWSRYASKISAI